MSKKIFFVAFEFPPLAGGGIQRSLKFATYLHESGIDPIVITPNAGGGMANPTLDHTLLDGLPESVIIERIHCPSPVQRTGFTGKLALWLEIQLKGGESQARLWKPQLERELPGLIARYQPQAIYLTIPPFSMASLWREYAARFDLPLVIDFRDAWSQWQSAPYATPLHYLAALRQERRVLQAASQVVCTSDQIAADLQAIHPMVSPQKFNIITNGYDADITDWSIMPPVKDDDGPFTIGYVGSFYYTPANRQKIMRPRWQRKPHQWLQFNSRKEDWLYRSPFFFFQAMAHLLEAQPALRQRVRIRFAGHKPDWLADQVRQFKLDDITEFLGYLEHDAVLKFQADCDCLLVTSAKVIGGKDYSIAGKTFEYFSMRKPILAFVTHSVQKDILERSGMAVICDPDDVSDSADRLARLMDGQVQLTPDGPFLDSLHRRELTRKLAEVLEKSMTDQPVWPEQQQGNRS